MADLVGSNDHIFHLLAPLEQLVTTEESTVRNKAVESICNLVESMSDNHMNEYFVPLLRRLTTKDW